MMRKRAVPIAGAVLVAAMLATPAAAKGRPTAEDFGNNLSQPSMYVLGEGVTAIPSTAPQPRVACDGAPHAPGTDGVPATTDGYWLQKTAATWGGTCVTASQATVRVDWGDNLMGDTALKAGKVIRVEVGLEALTTSGGDLTPAEAIGYTIVNLSEEGVPDRLAVYGTADTVGSPSPVMVWDHDADLTIATRADDGSVSDSFTTVATAEVNSTGKIVYGFNWGQKGDFPPAGDYVITFTVSDDTTIASVVGWDPDTMERHDHSVSLDITLSASAGGGSHAR
ncbi:hypothetical protein [Demequina capsici]|uniref:Uncharacterized protein n=1 Tax=Demequina capsici TaxID=3075620 RepID=A0AA96J889_9MICO|nr:hypothetical protein [Demequina sp. OYTSA14]WNM25185.1 hypothetical protein RN606_03285 [Demequina sp. OYTSA14]